MDDLRTTVGAAAYLFSLCLTEDFLVRSSNIICRLSLSGAFFFSSNNSGISGCCCFYDMGDYIAVFSAGCSTTPWWNQGQCQGQS